MFLKTAVFWQRHPSIRGKSLYGDKLYQCFHQGDHSRVHAQYVLPHEASGGMDRSGFVFLDLSSWIIRFFVLFPWSSFSVKTTLLRPDLYLLLLRHSVSLWCLCLSHIRVTERMGGRETGDGLINSK